MGKGIGDLGLSPDEAWEGGTPMNDDPLSEIWCDTNPSSISPPEDSGDSPKETKITTKLLTNELVTMDSSLDTIAHVSVSTMVKLFNKCRGINSYRSLAVIGPAFNAIARNSFGAVEDLAKRGFGKGNEPTGMQEVYTRNWKFGRVGRKWGRKAYHFPRGRPPKTLASVMRTYLAYLKSRRKGLPKAKPRPGQVAKPPKRRPGAKWHPYQTKNPRPLRTVPRPELGKRGLGIGKQPLLDSAFLREAFMGKVSTKLQDDFGGGSNWIVGLATQSFESFLSRRRTK